VRLIKSTYTMDICLKAHGPSKSRPIAQANTAQATAGATLCLGSQLFSCIFAAGLQVPAECPLLDCPCLFVCLFVASTCLTICLFDVSMWLPLLHNWLGPGRFVEAPTAPRGTPPRMHVPSASRLGPSAVAPPLCLLLLVVV
jgi:hypothetical protein